MNTNSVIISKQVMREDAHLALPWEIEKNPLGCDFVLIHWDLE
jgi:hypothetical protein